MLPRRGWLPEPSSCSPVGNGHDADQAPRKARAVRVATGDAHRDRRGSGARRPGQVNGWLPAATLELKEDDLADIAAAVYATGADTGPAAPALATPHQ